VEFGSGCAEYGEIGFPGSEDEETSHGEPTHTSEDTPLGGGHVEFVKEREVRFG